MHDRLPLSHARHGTGVSPRPRAATSGTVRGPPNHGEAAHVKHRRWHKGGAPAAPAPAPAPAQAVLRSGRGPSTGPSRTRLWFLRAGHLLRLGGTAADLWPRRALPRDGPRHGVRGRRRRGHARRHKLAGRVRARYRSAARRGATRAWLAGCAAFTAATIALSGKDRSRSSRWWWGIACGGGRRSDVVATGPTTRSRGR
jgi:hypothetical protein